MIPIRWFLGLVPYIILPDGRILAHYDTEDGSILVILQKSNHQDVRVEEIRTSNYLPSDQYSFSSFCLCGDLSPESSAIYCIGGSPTDPSAIWRFPVLQGGDIAVKISSTVDSESLNLETLLEYFSTPQKVAFPNKRKSLSYGYLYLPNHLSMPEEGRSWKPPLLVKVLMLFFLLNVFLFIFIFMFTALFYRLYYGLILYHILGSWRSNSRCILYISTRYSILDEPRICGFGRGLQWQYGLWKRCKEVYYNNFVSICNSGANLKYSCHIAKPSVSFKFEWAVGHYRRG